MILALLLSACTTGAGTGGDMPAYCSEDSRVAVTDLTVNAAGFSFTPQAAIYAETGRFDGPLTPLLSAPQNRANPMNPARGRR